MKISSVLVFSALLSTPALAQGVALVGTAGVPAYQLGSGVTAGGPARELNFGGRGPLLVDPATDLATVQGGGRTHGFDAGPAYQRGSGTTAGGPANELNRSRGRFSFGGSDLSGVQGGGRTHGVY